jgi:phosphohistidine swiveling domain-containing protein
MVNNSKTIFEKKYTRDYSLIIEEAWSASFLKLLEKELNWKNPFRVHGVYYLNKGVLEVWENKLATNWVVGKLLNENKNGTAFIKKISSKHKNDLKEFDEKYRNLKFSKLSELKGFINWVFGAMVNFTLVYLTATDERTPFESKKIALELREKDSFFEDINRTIRRGITELYPTLKGVENALLVSEIKSPKVKDLEKRQNGFVFIPGVIEENSSLEEFSAVHKEYDFKHETIDKISNGLKGQVAFRGIVRGKVRLLFKKSQLDEVLDGEVIVSPMTTPDMISAMKKAAAFVTDEGGIMCHAAIIAREMKKPCITGTKYATKLLKNGDLVEVDANTGLVKKLT